jgi:hypothetical protein
MKHQRSLIRTRSSYRDLTGQFKVCPNSNRPNGRLRDLQVRDGRVVKFTAPSTGDPEKRTNNGPPTNTEVIREAKQLNTYKAPDSNRHRHQEA